MVSQMRQNERYVLALSFWEVALQYLDLVANASREIARSGNPCLVLERHGEPLTPESYTNRTQWSDHRIVIPVLFNLLHGIELLIKGFILADPKESLAKRHNLSKLRMHFERKYPNEFILLQFFKKYTSDSDVPELLRQFLPENGLTMDELYQALRYPSPDFREMRRYTTLKYQDTPGAAFFAELSEDVFRVRRAAVQLGRSLELNASTKGIPT